MNNTKINYKKNYRIKGDIMKRILIMLLSVFIVTGGYGQNLRNVLHHISVIETKPLSAQADIAYEKVLKFATISDKVTVKIDAKLCPSLKYRNIKTKWSALLIGSFIAGNIKPQILKRIKKNHGYEGLLLSLNTYLKIKRVDENFKIKEMEKFLKLKAEKKLRIFILKK